MKLKRETIRQIIKEELQDKEGKMAQNQLNRTVELASMLKKEFDVNTDLPEWVESKITKAEDYLSTVFDYMRGKAGLGEEKLTEGSDTFVNILTKFGFKKGARDWGGHHFFVHKSKGLYATYHPAGRSLVIEPKRGGKPVFDSDRSNFSIKALLNYLQSPSNKFVSTEGKLTEKKQLYVVASTNGNLYTGDKGVTEKQALNIMDRYSKVGMNLFMLGVQYWNKPHKYNKKKIMVKEAGSIGGAIKMGGDVGSNYLAPKRDTKGGPKNHLQKFSSKEARNIIDGQLKMMAKDLRKVQNRVIKTWMQGAKSGAIDFFDIIRGLKTGDVSRAHPYEIDFLVNVLTKDKIIDRFRSYFNGKKGKESRTKKR